MDGDDGYASDGPPRSYATSPYAKKFSAADFGAHLDLDTFFKRSMSIEAGKTFAHRPSLRLSVFDEQLDSTALPFARQLRRRSKREIFLQLPSSCGPLLPKWPAVDDDLVADLVSKRLLLSFELDPTTLPTDVLCHLATEMFVSVGLPAGLEEFRVRRFILAVRAAMLDNPYHNFYHVFDVMQTTYALATATGTMARLDAWERFALLSAALCHDLVHPKASTLNPQPSTTNPQPSILNINPKTPQTRNLRPQTTNQEHPGVTSGFLSKAGDAAHGYKHLIFRDALLEKHHALRALGVMVDSHVQLLEGLSTEEYYQFRSTVSKIILATDITRHKEYLADLKEFAARRAEDPAAEMDKQLAMELMVKCADISNVIKPEEVARRWALRVTDEFFHQGDAERSLGIEVSTVCDRLATSRVALQTGFIDFMAGPLFTQVGALFPAALQAPLAQLAANRASYSTLSDAELEQSRELRRSSSEASVTHTDEMGGSGGSSVGSHAERCGSDSSDTEAGEASDRGRGLSSSPPRRVEWFMVPKADESERPDPPQHFARV